MTLYRDHICRCWRGERLESTLDFRNTGRCV